jgi:hypothetical protein
MLISRRFFFHLFGKKLDYLHLKDFLKKECELYLKQPLTPTTTQEHCCLPHLKPWIWHWN